MNLALFGGTGATGKVFIPKALNRKHNLKMLSRSEIPSKVYEGFNDQVQIIKGDILDEKSVSRTIENTEAVISLIGHRKNSPPDLQVKGIQNILKAMKINHVHRLIVLTGNGVWTEDDRPGVVDKIMTRMLGIIDKKRINDGRNHIEIVKNSNTNWTVVRTPLQTNSKAVKEIAIGAVGQKDMRFYIPRENIAEFILDILEDEKFYKRLPAIAAKK